MDFTTNNPSYHHLKKKWTAYHREVQQKVWDNHGTQLNWLSKNFPSKQLLAGSLGSLLLLTSPNQPVQGYNPQIEATDQILKATDHNIELASQLKDIVPNEQRVLTPDEENKIIEVLDDNFNFSVKAEIENKRMNRNYGVIGGEQHLYRYPGDTLQKHADNASDWAMYGSSGIAPGLGAWGYFTSSESEFTEKDKLREKYYIAIQTFLSPGFESRVAEYRDFFKFRKVLVVNPKTGQAVVTVVGDAGPSPFTGKHLGGSPEVMHYLGLAKGPRKGDVLYFFIDDPNDTVQLGPVETGQKES